MRRDLKALAGRTHDLIVVGAGLHGAWAAWDGALRGLRVALIERDDLGGATSANSLKVLHGGFRYLQSADIGRLRSSHRETLAQLRLAPHLCRPLPCLLPLKGWGKRGPVALGLGGLVFNLLVSDLRASEGGGMPAVRLLDRGQMARWVPENLTGGARWAALWYDGLLADAPRLTLELAQSAVAAGAMAANYLEVTGWETRDGAVTGVRALDRESGSELVVPGRAVLVTAGAATANLCGRPEPAPGLAHAYNLVLDRRPPAAALALASLTNAQEDPVCGGGRFLFMVPWQGRTLLGTSYWPCLDPPASARPRVEHLAALLEEFNRACPALNLRREEVVSYHWGLMPLARAGEKPAGGGLADKPFLRHHARDGGPRGLFSLRPVKLTTARATAALALDLAGGYLGAAGTACRTLHEPLWSGRGDSTDQAPGALGRQAWNHLQGVYGGQAARVAALVAEDPALAHPLAPDCPELGCQVVFAARQEMARTLSDLALRRTGLGQGGRPPAAALAQACVIMARELGWDQDRARREMEEVNQSHALLDKWRE
jgi:glycerol-3-phosphate dehydrogenase